MTEDKTEETTKHGAMGGSVLGTVVTGVMAVAITGIMGTMAILGVSNYKQQVEDYKAKSVAADVEFKKSTDKLNESLHGDVSEQTSSETQDVAPTQVTPVSVPEAPPIDWNTPLTILGFSVGPLLAIKFTAPVIMSRVRKRREAKASILAHAQTWEELYKRKDALILQWSRYETDVSLMIDYPVMTDYTDSVIRSVITAMQKLRRAETATVRDDKTSAEGSALQTAVDEFEVAFIAAEKYAKTIGQTQLSVNERKKLSAARTALNIILNEESPAYEIEAAYKSLRGSLKGIIDLPQVAIAELESFTRKSLEAVPA